MRAGRQSTDFRYLHFVVEVQECVGAQAADIDAGFVDVNHVDVKVVDRSWSHARPWVERMARPFIVLSLQVKTPNVFLLVQIKRKQAVIARRRQEDRVLPMTDFMTVFEVAISEGILDLEVAVITEELVACGDIDVVARECDASQATIGTAAVKVDLGRVPVDLLLAFLFLKVDGEYAAVALALPAATHDRSRDQLR